MQVDETQIHSCGPNCTLRWSGFGKSRCTRPPAEAAAEGTGGADHSPPSLLDIPGMKAAVDRILS